MRMLIWKELRQSWVKAMLPWLFIAIGLFNPQLMRDFSRYGLTSLVDGWIANTLVIWLWFGGVMVGTFITTSDQMSGNEKFLDALPYDRRLLWRAKLFAGIALMAAQIAGEAIISVAAIGLLATDGSFSAFATALSLVLTLWPLVLVAAFGISISFLLATVIGTNGLYVCAAVMLVMSATKSFNASTGWPLMHNFAFLAALLAASAAALLISRGAYVNRIGLTSASGYTCSRWSSRRSVSNKP